MNSYTEFKIFCVKCKKQLHKRQLKRSRLSGRFFCKLCRNYTTKLTFSVSRKNIILKFVDGSAPSSYEEKLWGDFLVNNH